MMWPHHDCGCEMKGYILRSCSLLPKLSAKTSCKQYGTMWRDWTITHLNSADHFWNVICVKYSWEKQLCYHIYIYACGFALHVLLQLSYVCFCFKIRYLISDFLILIYDCSYGDYARVQVEKYIYLVGRSCNDIGFCSWSRSHTQGESSTKWLWMWLWQ